MSKYASRFAIEVKRIISNDEEFEVEDIKGTLYVFTSELNTLRLLAAYRWDKNARQGWSPNLQTYFFSKELSI